MKKFMIIGTMALVGVFSFAGCTSKTPTVYETLNELAQKEYSSIALNVSMTLNRQTLTGEYRSTATENGYQIFFSYEQISTFEEKEGEIIIPDSFITTYSGTVEVSNGSVISQSGDSVDLPIGQLTAAGLNFSESNFSEILQTEGRLTAKVEKSSAFLGRSVSASDMTIDICYNAEWLSSMIINYTSNGGATVILSYTFTA